MPKHRIQGDLELLGLQYMGNAQSEGTTRTIQLIGSETNIGLIITTKGTGTVQVPAGYEANVSSDQDLINRAYAHSKVAGITAGALVTAPGADQDGFAMTYNHATTSYTLTAVLTALTFGNGLTKTGSDVKLGGDITDAATNLTQKAIGVTRLRSMYTSTTDEAGVAVEAVAIDNNQVTLYGVGGSIRITPLIMTVTAPGAGAFKYAADYSADYEARTMPDVGWSSSHIGGLGVNANVMAPGAGENGYVLSWDNATSAYKLIPASTASASYETIEDEGTPVAKRSTMNFVGSGVAVTDAGGKTVVTIGAVGVSGLTATRVPYASGASSLADDALFVWDATNKALTIGTARYFTINKTADDLFIGESAGNFTTTGTGGNIGIGYLALSSLTTGIENTAVGWSAGKTMTDAVGNTFFGIGAGELATGSFNTAVGRAAGSDISTGTHNTIIGHQTAPLLNTGIENVVVGANAGSAMLGASGNVVIGTYSGAAITTGLRNVTLGYLALTDAVTASDNTAIGFRALENATGSKNTGLGAWAGDNITTGGQNVIIGSDIDAQSASANGQLSIQNIIFGLDNTATGTTISSGSIGIGEVPAAGFSRLQVTKAKGLVASQQTVLRLDDSTTLAIGVGASIGLWGVATSGGGKVMGAAIEAYKLNATDGMYEFGLKFHTRLNGSTLTEAMYLTHEGKVGVCVTPTARLHANEGTLGNAVLKLTSTATNDDPTVTIYQNRVTTTDATVTTLHTLAIPTDTAVWLEVSVVARRTGGVAGAAGDSAGYFQRVLFKNIAGTVTQVSSTWDVPKEDQAAWNMDTVISGTDVLIQVTGAVDNNITWHLSELKVMHVSS